MSSNVDLHWKNPLDESKDVWVGVVNNLVITTTIITKTHVHTCRSVSSRQHKASGNKQRGCSPGCSAGLRRGRWRPEVSDVLQCPPVTCPCPPVELCCDGQRHLWSVSYTPSLLTVGRCSLSSPGGHHSHHHQLFTLMEPVMSSQYRVSKHFRPGSISLVFCLCDRRHNTQ